MTRPRVLVAFAGGRGHLEPMLPLAAALDRAGYEVALAGDAAALRDVRHRGAVFPFPTRLSTSRSTGVRGRFDPSHEVGVVGRWFAGRLGLMDAAAARAVIEAWRPGLVVHDELAFGAAWAAEAAGLSRVRVLVIASGALVRAEALAGPVGASRAALGLPADPDLDALDGDLVVSTHPPAFRDPAHPLPPGAVAIRPPAPPAAPSPHWRPGDGARIHATLGTVFNRESGDLLHRILAGLELTGARAVVTVGHDLDPSSFGAGDRIAVERFVPQIELMAGCDLLVGHGGSGSTMTALTCGVPVLLLPMGADHGFTADRVEALDLGERLDPATATPGAVAAAIDRLVSSATLHARTRAFAADAAALPPAESLVPRIAALLDR